jgi:hypothetical protein
MTEPTNQKPLPRRNELVLVRTATDVFIDDTNERMAAENGELVRARQNPHRVANTED